MRRSYTSWGGILAGGGIYLYEFRSRLANFRGVYLFIGAGLAAGGGFGGTTAPSPSDVIHNTQSNLWSPVRGERSFSANDLDTSFGRITTAGVSPTYGYSLTYISAGVFPSLFSSQDVSGWGAGLAAGGSTMVGLWQRMNSGGQSNYY